jgi:hypothetical protein
MEQEIVALDDAERWPSVARAYDFVLPSYQMLVSRFEAADTRLTSLLTFTASMLVGLPVLARAIRPDIRFDSPLFIAATSLLATAVALGLVGRVRGRLTLVNPRVLYRESLAEPEWEFKKNAVLYAGKHFDANAAAVKVKSRFATVMGGFMLLALIAAVVWLAR